MHLDGHIENGVIGLDDPVTLPEGAKVRVVIARSFVEDDGPDMWQVGEFVERAMWEDDAGDPTLEFYQKQFGQNQ